jgi:hypothetical protein
LSRRRRSILIVSVRIQRGRNLTGTNRAIWVPAQEPIPATAAYCAYSKTGRLP